MQALIRCTMWLILFWRTILTFIPKKRSFNKLKHKNLWKCRSRKLECFLTKNVNPLHCCEIHCLLSSQNKQPVTKLQVKNDGKFGMESSISMSLEVSSFGKTRIAVNLHFIDRICIADWIYRFCFGYEIQKKGGEFDVHNDIVLFSLNYRPD